MRRREAAVALDTIDAVREHAGKARNHMREEPPPCAAVT
jgi:hypothetical protein